MLDSIVERTQDFTDSAYTRWRNVHIVAFFAKEREYYEKSVAPKVISKRPHASVTLGDILHFAQIPTVSQSVVCVDLFVSVCVFVSKVVPGLV